MPRHWEADQACLQGLLVLTIGVNGFDTIFIIIVGLSGFIMGAAAMQDLERKQKNDE